MDENSEAELERRLALLDDPESGESVLPPLPLRDVVLTLLGLAVLSLALLWWTLG